MQQSKIEHKNTIRDKREKKGRVLAISRRIYRLVQTDVFYVESELTDNLYYFVKFKPDVIEFCSCKDYESNCAQKCKHIFALEFAIRMGILKDTDRLPAEAKREGLTPIANTSSYTEDDYSFRR
jgi:hypothetical protein